MKKRAGNQMRQSTARRDDRVADNLPDRFPVESWKAFYWYMNNNGDLEEGRAVIHVPQGVGDMTRRVEAGEPGVIENVRRWGVALRGGILEAIDFDTTPLLSHDRDRFPNDDLEALYLVTHITHFDLPGFFIIASEEHPFLLFDPQGELKGSYTRWYTFAGALAYLVTDGRLMTSFGLTWEKDRLLYAKVMRALHELKEKRRTI